MADDNEIRISITLDDGSVREGFVRIRRDGEDAGASIAQQFSLLKQQLLGLFAVKEVFQFIKEGFAEAVHQASDTERAVNQLNNSLIAAGRYSEATSAAFQKMAEDLQDTITVSDDTVLGLEKLAIQYTKTNTQAMKLTETAVNFAAVTDGDVNNSLTQLAATLSGSAGRLARLYPELQQFTSAQLKAGAAIDFFNSRFQGQAERQVNTYAGRVAQLTNAYDDLLKTLGKFVTSSPAVLTTIKAITDLMKNTTDGLKKSLGGADIFKDIIINFSVIAQAGVETARQIGLAFTHMAGEVAALWAKTKVLFTLGLSDKVNQELLDINNGLELIENEFNSKGANSPIIQWFDKLIQKVSEAKAVTTDQLQGMGQAHDALSGKNYTLLQSFSDLSLGAQEYAQEMADGVSKSFRQLGQVAIQGLANAVSAGMAAIGRALVKGEDIFQAFAGAMLSALGQAAIQMGAMYIMMGIARGLSSYGFDPTAWGLISVGSAMSVLGGALMAIGQGGSSGSVNTGGASSGGGGVPGGVGGGVTENPATSVKDQEQQRVTVNIHGDVFDTQETGLRLVEILNDSFKTQGAQVLVR